MTVRITFEQLQALLRCRFGNGYRVSDRPHSNSPLSQREILEGIVEHQAYLDQYGIRDNRFRVMHFVSQAAHETDQFRTLREYHDGSNYEGRTDLGNTQPGDGRRFRGRGIFQLTGRYNYTQAAGRLGVDLVGNPELAELPDMAVRTAGDYWQSRNMGPMADGDDEDNIRRVTRAINGGYNGYADRRAYFMCAGRIWRDDVTTPPPLPPEPPEAPSIEEALRLATTDQLIAELRTRPEIESSFTMRRRLP